MVSQGSLYHVHWARWKWRSRLRSAVPVTTAWLISINGQLTWLQRSLTLNLSCLTLQMIGGTCVIKEDVIIMVWSFKERTLLFPFPAKCKDWSLSPVQLHLWIWTHYLGATWFDWLAGDYKYRSFVTYRTRFSHVFSYIIQLRRKDSRQSCVTL